MYFFLDIPDVCCWKNEVWIASTGILRQWQSGRNGSSGWSGGIREQSNPIKQPEAADTAQTEPTGLIPWTPAWGSLLWLAPSLWAQLLPGLRQGYPLASWKNKSRRTDTGWEVSRPITWCLTLANFPSLSISSTVKQENRDGPNNLFWLWL